MRTKIILRLTSGPVKMLCNYKARTKTSVEVIQHSQGSENSILYERDKDQISTQFIIPEMNDPFFLLCFDDNGDFISVLPYSAGHNAPVTYFISEKYILLVEELPVKDHRKIQSLHY